MDSPDFLNSRLRWKPTFPRLNLLPAGEESRCPLCDGLCRVSFLNRPQSVPVDHGLINYIDTKAKCRHLQKLPEKGLCGTCLSV
jgi:hypothetical protein